MLFAYVVTLHQIKMVSYNGQNIICFGKILCTTIFHCKYFKQGPDYVEQKVKMLH